ncbi:MAG TPA: hypothetical protein VL172_19865 [Kofleriaceae bacterium]|nr:hypothetical protein [Kofleriaceae bacterium]
MSDQPRKPSAWWYAVACAIIVIGSGASVFYGCGAAKRSIAGMDRHQQPGAHQLQLDAARVTLFFESAPPEAATLDCRLTGAGGKSVPLTAPSVTQTYDLGGYHGRSQFAAEVEEAGRYTLTCAYPGGSGPPVTVAVGGGFSVGSILLAIVGVAGSIFISVPIMVITLVRRRSRSRPDYTRR